MRFERVLSIFIPLLTVNCVPKTLFSSGIKSEHNSLTPYSLNLRIEYTHQRLIQFKNIMFTYLELSLINKVYITSSVHY